MDRWCTCVKRKSDLFARTRQEIGSAHAMHTMSRSQTYVLKSLKPVILLFSHLAYELHIKFHSWSQKSKTSSKEVTCLVFDQVTVVKHGLMPNEAHSQWIHSTLRYFPLLHTRDMSHFPAFLCLACVYNTWLLQAAPIWKCPSIYTHVIHRWSSLSSIHYAQTRTLLAVQH